MSKRLTIGSVCKASDPAKPKYIRINTSLKEPVVLKPGQYVNLESKSEQLARLEKAVSEGKLSGEIAEKARKRINSIPDWVLAELVVVSE